MAKKLNELYSPKAASEKLYMQKSAAGKDFVAKMDVKKTTDKSPATKDDALFNATNVKTFKRSANRFGYDMPADEKAYGVGGNIPGPNDQNSPPDNGSTVFPSGKFRKEDADLTDDEIDELLDMLGEILISEMEELDELEGKTLKSYVRKASGTGPRSEYGLDQRGEKEEDKSMSTDGTKYPEKQERHQKKASALYHKARNRGAGVVKAKNKIGSK